MLKLSKKTEYAIIAIIEMSDGEKGKLTTAKELSQKYNIPPEIMGKVLQKLAKEGIITSQQGVKGGYLLELGLDQININALITAVEGPIHLTDCTAEKGVDCCLENYCNIKTPMEVIQVELMKFFRDITLEDFKNKFKKLLPMLDMNESASNIN